MEIQLNLTASAAAWRTAGLSALCIVALSASSALLLAKLVAIGVRHAPSIGIATTAASAGLVGTCTLHWLPQWALALAFLAMFTGLISLAIDFADVNPLQAYASRARTGDDPAWWAEFERDFESYTSGEL